MRRVIKSRFWKTYHNRRRFWGNALTNTWHSSDHDLALHLLHNPLELLKEGTFTIHQHFCEYKKCEWGGEVTINSNYLSMAFESPYIVNRKPRNLTMFDESITAQKVSWDIVIYSALARQIVTVAWLVCYFCFQVTRCLLNLAIW